MIQNDTDAIGRLLSNDWIIIDPDGSVIDRSRFLAVIKSGALKHEAMDSEIFEYAPTEHCYCHAVTHTRRNIWRKSSLRVKEPRTFSRKQNGRAVRAHPPHHSQQENLSQ